MGHLLQISILFLAEFAQRVLNIYFYSAGFQRKFYTNSLASDKILSFIQNVQLTLVISTSLISNNHLSRSENLVSA